MHLFSIDFDNQKRVFFPGKTVAGKVNVHLTSERKIKAIYLILYGGAKTDWNEGDADIRGDHRPHDRSRSESNILENRTRAHSMLYHRRYRAEQVFFNEKILLTGNGDHGEHITLPAGEHSFPFSFQLPTSCLPSFEGWHGHIRYYAKAIIDRPTPHFDDHCKELFTVAGKYDLNRIPNAGLGINIDDSEKQSSGFWCCGSDSGEISSSMEIPKRAYVPGETIELIIKIKNSSDRVVKSEKMTLTQNILYYGRQDGLIYEKLHSITETRAIWEKKEPITIEPHSESTIKQSIAIPAVSHTSNNCEIIKIHYSIQCKAAEGGLHHSFTTSALPVIIGTVPITTGDKLPAVYENCVFGKTYVKEHDDNEQSYGTFLFAPKYATYLEQTFNA